MVRWRWLSSELGEVITTRVRDFSKQSLVDRATRRALLLTEPVVAACVQITQKQYNRFLVYFNRVLVLSVVVLVDTDERFVLQRSRLITVHILARLYQSLIFGTM